MKACLAPLDLVQEHLTGFDPWLGREVVWGSFGQERKKQTFCNKKGNFLAFKMNPFFVTTPPALPPYGAQGLELSLFLRREKCVGFFRI